MVARFPILVIIAVFMFFMRQMQGGGGGGRPMSFGKSKARLGEDQVKTTWPTSPVATRPRRRSAELVEFLRDPGKFQRLGGNVSRAAC